MTQHRTQRPSKSFWGSSAHLLGLIAVLLIGTPHARGDDGSVATDGRVPGEPGLATELLHADHLGGDWGGWRPRLAEHGLSVDLIYVGEFFTNTRGGIRTNNASDYRGDLSLFLELDTEAAGWWNSGRFFAHIQSQHGEGITEDFVGDFQTLSNLDADDFTQVSELWYLHEFAEERVWLKIGKQEANADFAFVENGAEFINSSAGVSPTIPIVTFPDQDWGIVAGFAPCEGFSVNAGIYQGRPDGGQSIGSTLDNLYGPMVMVEPTLHYHWGEEPGSVRVGGWWNGDRFDELDESNPSPGTFGENYGGYLTWDQGVWRESRPESSEAIAVFGQIGWSPEDRNEATQYFGAGLKWNAALAGRDDDALGLGIFHVIFSDEAGFAENDETAIELFYKAQLTGWLIVKPDVQFIANPGGTSNADAIAVGLRFEIAL